MAKKLIDLDESLLEQARAVLGETTMKATVNQALAEVVRLAHRRAHAERLTTMTGLELDDETVMDGAWR